MLLSIDFAHGVFADRFKIGYEKKQKEYFGMKKEDFRFTREKK